MNWSTKEACLCDLRENPGRHYHSEEVELRACCTVSGEYDVTLRNAHRMLIPRSVLYGPLSHTENGPCECGAHHEKKGEGCLK